MGSNLTRRPKNRLWMRLHVGLDDDQRIVLPWMYEESRLLYDQLVGVAYLIREKHPDAEVDWVWASAIDRVAERMDFDILEKLYVVRLRLPWNEVDYEWLCTQGELNEHREDYEIIQVFTTAKDIRTNIVGLVQPLDLEEHPEHYQVVERRYLVCWKSDTEKAAIDVQPIVKDRERVQRILGE